MGKTCDTPDLSLERRTPISLRMGLVISVVALALRPWTPLQAETRLIEPKATTATALRALTYPPKVLTPPAARTVANAAAQGSQKLAQGAHSPILWILAASLAGVALIVGDADLTPLTNEGNIDPYPVSDPVLIKLLLEQAVIDRAQQQYTGPIFYLDDHLGIPAGVRDKMQASSGGNGRLPHNILRTASISPEPERHGFFPIENREPSLGPGGEHENGPRHVLEKERTKHKLIQLLTKSFTFPIRVELIPPFQTDHLIFDGSGVPAVTETSLYRILLDDPTRPEHGQPARIIVLQFSGVLPLVGVKNAPFFVQITELRPQDDFTTIRHGTFSPDDKIKYLDDIPLENFTVFESDRLSEDAKLLLTTRDPRVVAVTLREILTSLGFPRPTQLVADSIGNILDFTSGATHPTSMTSGHIDLVRTFSDYGLIARASQEMIGDVESLLPGIDIDTRLYGLRSAVISRHTIERQNLYFGMIRSFMEDFLEEAQKEDIENAEPLAREGIQLLAFIRDLNEGMTREDTAYRDYFARNAQEIAQAVIELLQ